MAGDKVMLTKMAEEISLQMITHKIIKIEDRDYYIYGIELLLCNLFIIAGITAIAIVTGTIVTSIIYSLAFCLLRAYAGGYHCKTYLKCFCTSIGIYICMVATNLGLAQHKNILSVLLLAISIPIVFIFAPVVHENNPLEELEKVKNRKITLFLLLVFFVVSLIGLAIKQTDGVYAISCATTAVAVLIIMSKTGGMKDEKGNTQSCG